MKLWGGFPEPRWSPWTLNADGGVGSGRGRPPHFRSRYPGKR
jgi:hypothetical protein